MFRWHLGYIRATDAANINNRLNTSNTTRFLRRFSTLRHNKKVFCAIYDKMHQLPPAHNTRFTDVDGDFEYPCWHGAGSDALQRKPKPHYSTILHTIQDENKNSELREIANNAIWAMLATILGVARWVVFGFTFNKVDASHHRIMH